jgi:hypothetical protein
MQRIFILMIWMEAVDDARYQSTSSDYFHGKHDIKDASWPYRTSLAEDEIWP